MEINIKRLLFLFFILGFTNHFCFSQKNNLDNPFLIVLDVQKNDADKHKSDRSYQTFIEAVNDAIEHSNPQNVIYSMGIHLQLNLSLTFPNIYVSINTEAIRLDDRMSVVNKITFLKEENMGNVFNVEKLSNFLKKNTAKKIILIGLLAEDCVYQSCIGGLAQNYDISIIPEAIFGKSEESKAKAIKELLDKGVKVSDFHFRNSKH